MYHFGVPVNMFCNDMIQYNVYAYIIWLSVEIVTLFVYIGSESRTRSGYDSENFSLKCDHNNADDHNDADDHHDVDGDHYPTQAGMYVHAYIIIMYTCM